MKNRQQQTTDSSHRQPGPIPTREEFHRYDSGLITLADFSTEHPNPYTIDKIATSLRWSENHMNLKSGGTCL